MIFSEDMDPIPWKCRAITIRLLHFLNELKNADPAHNLLNISTGFILAVRLPMK
jgi:hypothetical protein